MTTEKTKHFFVDTVTVALTNFQCAYSRKDDAKSMTTFLIHDTAVLLTFSEKEFSLEFTRNLSSSDKTSLKMKIAYVFKGKIHLPDQSAAPADLDRLKGGLEKNMKKILVDFGVTRKASSLICTWCVACNLPEILLGNEFLE